jgi:UDP-3-O-[3-hydroxymyristoyl] N-acetylglucosamine deacetylase
VHSGQTVNVTIHPAPPNHGIQFKRLDIPESPSIPAIFSKVVDTSLATVIGDNGCIVSTIEHLMACFSGLCIDNALVELDAYELPIMDGSSGPFTRLLQGAGRQTQEAFRQFFIVKSPIGVQENGKSVCIYPSDGFKVTYTIEFDHPLVKTQNYSVSIFRESFAKEISHARTFGFIRDIEMLKTYGLAKGGSFENAIVLDAETVLNPEGLRYENEFVRHKILDCIGDLSLLGMPILGHVVLNRSGHTFNHLFLEKFFTEKNAWEARTLEKLIKEPEPGRAVM